MKMKKLNFYIGAAVSSLLLALMVILAELHGPFKALLKGAFGHHWIGKAVIIAVVFFAVACTSKKKSLFGMRDDKAAWYSALLALGVILLFFVAEFLG